MWLIISLDTSQVTNNNINYNLREKTSLVIHTYLHFKTIHTCIVYMHILSTKHV